MKKTGPIVAAVDFSEESSAVASHAIAMAEQAKLPLILVHVIDTAILHHHAIASGRSPQECVLVSQAQARLAAMLAGGGGYSHADTEVVCDRPVDGIHAIVEKSGPSLLVMGANDLTKKRLGSVAANCLRTAPCDVLILRDWQGITFKKILVCTDFSPASGRALEQGVSWAGLYGAKLDIAYVMYPPSRNMWGEILAPKAEGDESFTERCRKSVKAEMDTFLGAYAPNLASVDHSITILEGVSPGLVLQHHVKDTGADLAVLGSRHHSRLANLFSASTAEYLLHETPASVLAIRDKS